MREFDLGDILTITEGSLVSPRHMEGVHDILDYMTGDQLFTHALIRAANTCKPALLAQHPQLTDIKAPEWDRTGDVKAQVDDWLALMKLEHGDALPVAPLAEWHHIDPVQELAEMTERPDRIVVVETGAAS
jgi:hypothetical protein